MDYNEIVEKLAIRKGDRLWISSELIKLAFIFQKKGLTFDGSALLDTFQNAVGPTGTIMIPTFSFEFSNSGFYDILKSKGTSGVLGNIALSRKDFERTKHPLHSFAVWGKDKECLVSMNNTNSFGNDSPFGYCLGNHVRQIILGTDYVHAMTFIHYAEAVCNVPYRFIKKFSGKYIDSDRKEVQRTYDYHARNLDMAPKEVFNKIGSILENKGISKKILIDDIEFYDIDLALSFPVICEDIICNQCKNIYDFKVKRDAVFKN